MADIILAAIVGGQTWLVCGEPYIDDLLGNTLPLHISIEVVPCHSKTEVDALWELHDGTNADSETMWMIHPAIVNRVRGQAPSLTIVFAEWSAALDPAARDACAAAAAAQRTLVLTRHLAPDAPPMAADLANLRTALIEAHLATLGVPPARMTRETQPEGDPDTIELVLRG